MPNALRIRPLIAVLLVSLTATVFCTDSASAQSDGIPTLDDFNALRFRPAIGQENYMAVESARVRGDMRPTVGLQLDYAHQPFILYDVSCSDATETDCTVGEPLAQLQDFTITGNIMGSLTLFDRLEIGVGVPILYTSGEDFQYTDVATTTPVEVTGGSGVAVSDVRLQLRGRLYGGDRNGFGVAITGFASFPIGQLTLEERFVGDDFLTFGGHLILEFIESGFHIAGNIGGVFRPEKEFFSTRVGPELYYRAAIGYGITPLILLFAEVDGAASFGQDVDENPMEARLALRIRQSDFTFNIGGGMGILAGAGVPLFRVSGGLQWSPMEEDADGDDLLDADDGCPDEPEDFDNFEDEDGCPELDNDNDGIPDVDDRCPLDAEDMDGENDTDGCPDQDTDGDGVPDGFDGCPEEPEDMDGDRDEDGCPDADRDHDGIDDADDPCPDEAEDTDGLGDDDGCPEEDFDNDNIPDEADACPEQPESMNGVDDEDGCPETDQDGDGIADDRDQCPEEAETINTREDDDGCPDGPALVELSGDRLTLLRPIKFEEGTATFTGLSTTFLDALATLIQRTPRMRRVRIESHTADVGDRGQNMATSTERANTVLEYLVTKGVPRNRLVAAGVGGDRPVSSNSTDQGRAENDRVEFLPTMTQ